MLVQMIELQGVTMIQVGDEVQEAGGGVSAAGTPQWTAKVVDWFCVFGSVISLGLTWLFPLLH